MAATGDQRTATMDMQLIDDLAGSWQAIVTAMVGPNEPRVSNQIHDGDEVKLSIEQTIQRFLDHAKQLECFFLQKRLYLSNHKPEQLIAEEIADLKAEIQRKDEVMQRYQDKIVQWQSILSDQPMTPINPPPHGPPVMPGPIGPAGMRPGMLSAPMGMRPHGPPGMPPQMVPQMRPGFMPGGPMQPQPSNLQGPLAFLERTTSSIGEQRR